MPRPDRNGSRIARLFRQYRQVPDEPRACDLDAICGEDEIEIMVMEHVAPGFTACLICPSDDVPCAIALAPGQNPGRSRFSIAHELGHFHIPSHRKRPSGPCHDEDMDARANTDPGRNYEWEANDFAAELLMPRTLFLRDAAGRDPTFQEIADLASHGMYDVSMTAAALRYVETTRETCALVCAKEGVVEWVSKSDGFRYRIPWKGDPVPPGSSSRAVFDGEQSVATAEQLDPYTWLESEQSSPLELYESTLAIPTQSQVLSLLWAVAEC
jgi:hypothetical protein